MDHPVERARSRSDTGVSLCQEAANAAQTRRSPRMIGQFDYRLITDTMVRPHEPYSLTRLLRLGSATK